jgi:hypothetical protein
MNAAVKPPTDTTQRASWLDVPQVTAVKTAINSFSKRGFPLDGTYFSYRWERIINYNLFMNPKILAPIAKNRFCGIDPWFAHTRCRWRYILWDDLLRITEHVGGRVRQTTLFDAENQWWITSTTYERLFLYLWADGVDINRVQNLLRQNPGIDNALWMITKEGVGKIGIE